MLADLLHLLTTLTWIVLSVSFIGLLGAMLRGMYRALMEVGGLNGFNKGINTPRSSDEARELIERAYRGTYRKWVKSIVGCMLLLVVLQLVSKLTA